MHLPAEAHVNSTIQDVPLLEVAKRSRRKSAFRYRSKDHPDLPHVVKFSGGRSSGMLLYILLENGFLRADRGDVILFNNTGAEHPDTYDFVARCKHIAEEQYAIPFFLAESQTYEDVSSGEWTRLPTYRLVNAAPKSPDNPDGYSYRGEPFEELLSWSGYVPNQFSRTCTKRLKLDTTQAFLRDWLAGLDTIQRLGHWEDESQIEPSDLYRRHCRNGGGVPEDIFLEKKQYIFSCPVFRPEQRFADFSAATTGTVNPLLADRIFGGQASFGPDGVEYISFIGLRADEPERVQRVAARASGPDAQGYEGEHVYMPLADMKIENDDVLRFWKSNPDLDLHLPESGNLSNCVYCFLKGTAKLAAVHRTLLQHNGHANHGINEPTPSDIAWWSRIESLYARDMEAENRGTDGYVGFFGAHQELTYDRIRTEGIKVFDEIAPMLPCDCTD